MKKTYTFACIGMAALALTGCSIPRFDAPAPEPVQLKAPIAAKPKAVAAPVQTQAAVEVPEVAKPKKPWVHVPTGSTGSSINGGDEDGGWSG